MSANTIEIAKYIVCTPIFIAWTLYDIATRTVKISWLYTVFALALVYNGLIYLMDAGSLEKIKINVLAGIAGLIGAYVYHKLTGMGWGDVNFFAFVGLLFGIKVLIITVIVAFLALKLFEKFILRLIYRPGANVAVAFFPFITVGIAAGVLLFDYPTIMKALKTVKGVFDAI